MVGFDRDGLVCCAFAVMLILHNHPPTDVRNVNAGLAGFIDALVMGWRDAQPGRLTSQPTHDATSTGSEALKDDNVPPHMQQTSSASAAFVLGLGRPSTLGPDEMAFDHDLAPVKPPPRVARHIFATTYNMGGSGGLLDPGEVAGWIPLGYDLYAIGLQESERLSDVAGAVQKRIGRFAVGCGVVWWMVVVRAEKVARRGASYLH